MKNKTLVFIYFLIYSVVATTTSKAAVNFNNPYALTLNKLNSDNADSYPIDSGYTLDFEEVANPIDNPKNYNFINYILNADNSTTPLYYKIGYTASGGIGEELQQIIDTTTNPSPIGYFRKLTKVSTSGGSSPYTVVTGGAISNNGNTMENITADFIENSITSSYSFNDLQGGAIYNSGIIGNIFGDFIGNYVANTIANYTRSYGGAIYNDTAGSIGKITGNFVDNKANLGGAVYNLGTIQKITGDFIANHATQSGTFVNPKGGAIYTKGTIIEGIEGDFIGNYATIGQTHGGAIYVDGGNAGNIKGDFIGNYISTTYSAATNGGAIHVTSGSVNNIEGNFIGNYIYNEKNSGRGGAIYNGVGGRYAFTKGLSTYGSLNYTFGSNYESPSIAAGLNYAW